MKHPYIVVLTTKERIQVYALDVADALKKIFPFNTDDVVEVYPGRL